ncbi:hypothetical protein SAMD00019534_031470 [Acytostelium subglobosum LB1]|uniref:hypothetical protein n=1 Tax=Acytostelium subglobosum LB1 TaxID=1410327 RepID=UPI000644BB93|nr:hypothetical protein SAMD00019534_031470 [Acytostelium subglobosum LB1]GAM19972.1 hypothetical protein SAMD00019534_031470 [Acytostelium subglobosum LB1]|eukprot:XP_012756734.1 hypothetical protein SAMD00019534_031470 [Acytostelium subglobosum LB1]
MDIKFIHVLLAMLLVFALSRYTLIVTLPPHRLKLQEQQQQQQQTNIQTLVDAHKVIEHTERLIEIGNSRFVYEESRSLAREYIKTRLMEFGLPEDNIIWNRFEWVERYAVGKNITTTTWTGINIVVWTNTTALPAARPIRVIGAHYDTLHWGINRTSGAHDNLAATGLLIETIGIFFQTQQALPLEEQAPYMFLFFDQEEPGALGSKSFVDHLRISKNPQQYAYFVDIDAIGHRLAPGPILQTYPYEHQHKTHFSPRWLVDHTLASAYRVRPDGISVGNAHLGLSLLYQAHRYHLLSIPFLSDDGPFAWAGVPTILLTDLDIFYGHNPDIHSITDQPSNLDPESLADTSKILMEFLQSTNTDAALPPSSTKSTDMQNPLKRFTLGLIASLFETIFSGHLQYLAIGPVSIGYFELLSLIYIMIAFIYFNSFQAYRSVVLQAERLPSHRPRLDNISKKRFTEYGGGVADSDDKETLQSPSSTIYKRHSNNTNDQSAVTGGNSGNSTPEHRTESHEPITGNNVHSGVNNHHRHQISSEHFSGNKNDLDLASFRGYRVLFFHLFALSFIALIDTVYVFELLCLSFVSLTTIHLHRFNINLLTGFISGVFCANFIYKDITQILRLGRRGAGYLELRLALLMAAYIVHTILVVIYGYDFDRKKLKLKEYIAFGKQQQLQQQLQQQNQLKSAEKTT